MQRYLAPNMAEESKVGWTRALTSRLSLCALCTGLRYPHPQLSFHYTIPLGAHGRTSSTCCECEHEALPPTVACESLPSWAPQPRRGGARSSRPPPPPHTHHGLKLGTMTVLIIIVFACASRTPIDRPSTRPAWTAPVGSAP